MIIPFVNSMQDNELRNSQVLVLLSHLDSCSADYYYGTTLQRKYRTSILQRKYRSQRTHLGSQNSQEAELII